MDSESSRIEKLQSGSQWLLWKFQIKILLGANDLFGYVTGETEKDPAKVAAWKKNDLKAQRIIATAVGQQPLLHIVNCSTSQAMWEKLHTVYEQKSDSSVHLLQTRFYSFKMDPNDSIACHISKLEEVVQQLKDLNEEISDSMVMTKILMTLPPNYNHFHSAWESTSEDKRTLDHLRARLMIEESRMATQNMPTVDVGEALVAKQTKSKFVQRNKNRKPGKCFHCNESGHWKTNCPKLRSSSSSSGHKIHGGGEAFMSDASKSKIDEQCYWYVDSGATDHMCNNKNWFERYIKFKEPSAVRVGNGESIMAYGKGDIVVLAYDGVRWNRKHLLDVLFVPKIKLNLFSTGQAMDKGLKFSSDRDECKLYSGENVVAVGVRQQKLFRMLFKVQCSESNGDVIANAASHQIDSLKLWHERLCHQNVVQVKAYLNAMNIEYSDDELFKCEACIYGKHHRSSFQQSSERAKMCGGVVHSDVCGPMQVASFGGARYFVLFKDDYSNYRTVFFMKNKSEVIDHLKTFVQSMKKDTGNDLYILRTDNGLEYINKDVETYLKGLGIRHQRSVPYTPEHNGRAERDMRTIVEAARTMVHSKNLDLKFWAEAVNTAVYVLNRSGTSPTPGKTPSELWFKKEIVFEQFRVFGSEVYVHVPKEKRQKWDRKAEKGLFTGYCENTKGLRIFNEKKRKIEIVRDIIFNEKVSGVSAYDDLFVFDTNIGESTESELNISPRKSVVEISSDDEYDTPSAVENIEENGSVASRVDENSTANRVEESSMASRLRSKEKVSANFSDAERCAFLVQHDEPSSVKAALQSKESVQWKCAMDDEMNSLLKNETWKLVQLPADRKVIDNRWLFKVKCNPDGSVDRFKARLVVRGFSQEYGIDYHETFSPVVKFTSIRTILAIAAAEQMVLKSFDVKTAFLYGELDEDIFMSQPEGYDDNSGKVCKLLKSLYGLKQASRCWNKKFSTFLQKFNFNVCIADPCVYINNNNGNKIILAIYIDDGLVAANNEEQIIPLLEYLKKEFEIKVFDTKSYLGLEINRLGDGGFLLHQSGYAKRVLHRFKMLESNAVSTPADSNQVLCSNASSKKTHFPYREAIGCLMYLTVATRPDICYAVNLASRFMENPSEIHITSVKRILKYLKGTADYGITFKKQNNLKFIGFSDADYAGDVDTRRSTSGYVFQLGESVISWCSERQKTVALSTTESEYVAATHAIKELVWLRQLLNELLPMQLADPVFFMDNQSAIRLVKNPEFHKRTKHIDVKYHFIREKYEERLFILDYMPTENQVADVMTKSLAKQRFQRLREMMGVVLK